MRNHFMEPEITEKQTWFEIEDRHGETGICPSDCFDISDYPDFNSITRIEGHGARMQAPGYLDATEWSVYDTPAEAVENLISMYMDDTSEWTPYEINQQFSEEFLPAHLKLENLQAVCATDEAHDFLDVVNYPIDFCAYCGESNPNLVEK